MMIEDENEGQEQPARHEPHPATDEMHANFPSRKGSILKRNLVHPNLAAGSGKKHLKFAISIEDILKIDGSLEELKKLGGLKGVAHKLRVDVDQGIEGSPEELTIRSHTFGSNTYPVKKPKHFLEFVWEACQDETLLILVVCAVVSLVVGLTTEDPKAGWYDGAGIGFAVILVVMVASISDWKQSLQFFELSAEKRKIQINVTRSGRRCKLLIFDLIVGDIVHLNIGDQIPGDGILVEAHSLVIDESSMTGESDPMSKDAERPFLLSGCKVLDGFGTIMLDSIHRCIPTLQIKILFLKMPHVTIYHFGGEAGLGRTLITLHNLQVTAVGMNTEWGKVMATLSEEVDDSTPLQERLDSLATTIGKVGLGIAVIVFFVLLIRCLNVPITTNLRSLVAQCFRDAV